CYSEFGTRLDEVTGLSRKCGHSEMVEQAALSIGINYDDWIIIGTGYIVINVDVVRQG
ncbi:hypothetical protein A2U01_0089702, partial [Trifolium medium]|nr:hypothetical protein [Trifolium medium]